MADGHGEALTTSPRFDRFSGLLLAAKHQFIMVEISNLSNVMPGNLLLATVAGKEVSPSFLQRLENDILQALC